MRGQEIRQAPATPGPFAGSQPSGKSPCGVTRENGVPRALGTCQPSGSSGGFGLSTAGEHYGRGVGGGTERWRWGEGKPTRTWP